MPPKATGSSDRGGKSFGNGSLLTLPEPTVKKSSSISSGSPTQAGSLTQKTKFEGSSTQIATIKPKSSTQDSPKPVTIKNHGKLCLVNSNPSGPRRHGSYQNS